MINFKRIYLFTFDKINKRTIKIIAFYVSFFKFKVMIIIACNKIT